MPKPLIQLPPVPLEMKAITIIQPWASLIIHGVKRHETRSWRPGRFSGWIAIHAGKKTPERHLAHTDYLRSIGFRTWGDLPLGAVLGWAFLIDAHSTDNPHFLSQLTNADKDTGDYSPNRYAWELTYIYRLNEPVPARGMQGLWNWQRDDRDYPGAWI